MVPATNTLPIHTHALVVTALCSTLAACGPAAEQPGWREVSGASATSADVDAAPPGPTQCLGDPFFLVAQLEPSVRDTSPLADPASSPVHSAWTQVSSDACQVRLSSMSIAFERGGETSWLSTMGPTNGVVLDASPDRAVVRFASAVHIDRNEGWSTGQPVPASIYIEARQDGDQVRLWTEVHVEPTEGSPALHLDFTVQGAFDQDPEVIPERRLACP